ncbi:hypothetical protein [Rhabdochlamydiaceae symbiont of Dictyostelium giganteum]|uniref:hypothetical protein n=1 Tax=Rhabdochlamydiaceae symbiont of Dictyostelium giganteum TaxID=3342349 RepID=UPI00384AEEBE
MLVSKKGLIEGKNLTYREDRPVYIVGELFGWFIGLFLTTQNIDQNSIQLYPNKSNGLKNNSKLLFNQITCINPKTQILKKIGSNDDTLLHNTIVLEAIKQIKNTQKTSSPQGLIYKVQTMNQQFNVFNISNYGFKAPVHIGIKIMEGVSIAKENKPYAFPVEWMNSTGNKESQSLDLRDVHSYSKETMTSIGKANPQSTLKIHTQMMKLFKKWIE